MNTRQNIHPYNITRSILRIYGTNSARLLNFDFDLDNRISLLSRKNEKARNGRFLSSLSRSRSRVREYVLCNFFPGRSVFLTLTYKDNLQDYDVALRDFRRFLRKMRLKYPKIKYIAVAEKQKRGAIHFHLICNKEYISQKWLNLFWSHGFWFALKTHGKPQKLASYISKYISKDIIVTFSRKSYLSSRGLDIADVIDDFFLAPKVFANLAKFGVITNDFTILTDWGKIQVIDLELSP